MPRYFTVAEANALLPALRPHVRVLMHSWRSLVALHDEAVALLESKPRADVGGGVLAEAAAHIVRVQAAMAQIQAYGVDLKDPAIGLLDFPALRRGIVVYLCWRYGEPRVAFWHPIEAGYAGRQPIDGEDL